jgi:hypothetical protein
MKLLGAAVALAALVAATVVYFDQRRPGTSPASPSAPRTDSVASDRGESSAAQIDELRRELATMKSQAAGQQSRLASATPPTPAPREPASAEEMQEQRAADLESHRVYMSEVAESFAAETIDQRWAAQASSRVNAALYDHDALRTAARDIECRAQTCRVTIDDDGSGTLSRRLPSLALSLVDVLPTISAERVDQGNGRSAMILYMSAQREAPPRPK